MYSINKTDPFKKKLIFITGAPRSGTSLLTKVIDAHPEIAIFMENIFQNRRRHWQRADFWNSPRKLGKRVAKEFKRFDEPIIGNKVCTPDVWSADDIYQFCSLFEDIRLLFIIRDPVQVALSRFKREGNSNEFNSLARQNLLLDFRSRFLTYSSSWRKSITNYWSFKDAFPEKVSIVYYEDFCNNFKDEVKQICEFLSIPYSNDMITWYHIPHHDSLGNLSSNLKYSDAPIKININTEAELDHDNKKLLDESISTINHFIDLWKTRSL